MIAADKSAFALAARLKKRIRIERANYIADAAGGAQVNWVLVATVWAEMTPRNTSSESRFAGKLEARSDMRITLRYRSDITTAMRLVYEGRSFNIRSIRNVDEAGALLEIDAQEGAAL